MDGWDRISPGGPRYRAITVMSVICDPPLSWKFSIHFSLSLSCFSITFCIILKMKPDDVTESLLSERRRQLIWKCKWMTDQLTDWRKLRSDVSFEQTWFEQVWQLFCQIKTCNPHDQRFQSDKDWEEAINIVKLSSVRTAIFLKKSKTDVSNL